jgi:hypothetical protein
VVAASRASDAVRHAQHQRTVDLAAEHVARLGDLVGHLVHRARDEVGEMHVDHRDEAGHRRPHRRAHDRGLGDRRVQHSIGTELVDQPPGDPERHTEHDVLADAVHARIAPHLLPERQPERISEIHHRHGRARWTNTLAALAGFFHEAQRSRQG